MSDDFDELKTTNSLQRFWWTSELQIRFSGTWPTYTLDVMQ